MRRFFVVGTPRSGTTLLQTLIGSSGEYYITHESHLPLAITECFDKKFGIYRWVFQIILGVKFFKYFKCIYFPLCEKKSYIKFDDLMTKNAKSLGFSGYVEKTPSNLYVVEKLFMYIKNVKIIYISRSPGDNVKSYLKYSVFCCGWMIDMLISAHISIHRPTIKPASVQTDSFDRALLRKDTDRICQLYFST